ncbi:MAG: hypothetical protein R2734_01360 [Nocardioides sp.]
MARYGGELGAPLVMTAGSYLDHLAAGDGDWYPRWVNVLQLNWLYRPGGSLVDSGVAYTIETLHFVTLVVRARLRHGEHSD